MKNGVASLKRKKKKTEFAISFGPTSQPANHILADILDPGHYLSSFS